MFSNEQGWNVTLSGIIGQVNMGLGREQGKAGIPCVFVTVPR